jgi:hypothetical protein
MELPRYICIGSLMVTGTLIHAEFEQEIFALGLASSSVTHCIIPIIGRI